MCVCVQCNSMQGLYARLTGKVLCLIALCYANLFGVAYSRHLSWIDWGSICPAIYMHGPRSSSWYSSMQGIYAHKAGPSAFCIYALS